MDILANNLLAQLMLKTRIITAVILIPIVLLILFYLPPMPFLLLTGLVSLWGAWEWSHIMQMQKKSLRIAYVVLIAIVLYEALYISPLTIFFTAFIFWILASVLIFIYPRGKQYWSRSVLLRGLMGVLVLIPCWAAINYVRDQKEGAYGLLFLFVLIWGADSVAYFVGKKWGKTKLAALVSPGKSIQGAVGAAIFAIVMPFLLLWSFNTPIDVCLFAVLLSLVTVIFSIIGDLFESMHKREAGLKDSGQLLPGHGGLLDRIDSLTAAAPIFTLGGMLLGVYLH